METLEVLQKAKALIDKPQKWCKGHFAVDRLGRDVGSLDRDAARRCSLGALLAASGGGDVYDVTYSALNKASKACRGISIATLNDTTDHKTVMAVFDEAIRREQSKG